MDQFVIEGGATLTGSLSASGSKNSSLPILAATLLTGEQCVVRRVPDVSDCNYMLSILRLLGGEVERSSGRAIILNEKIQAEAPYELVRKMRASICVMGPLLARLGEARVSLPGGCVIGDRPIDLHLKGLENLGAKVSVKGGDIDITAPNGLVGAEMNLRGAHGPTVLGTDNVMMAATLAKGVTIIDGAAAEPEVEDLASFLNAMGAKIKGAGTRRIKITGVEKLHGIDYTVIPDRIEAGTYVIAGAMAGEGLRIRRTNAEHLGAVIDVLRNSGFPIEVEKGDQPGEDVVTVSRAGGTSGADITTEPFPGFPTDMQAQMCALYSTVPGLSVIHEQIFPERFMHVPELNRMGADIRRDGATAVIHGGRKLVGAPVMASDLRASAALVLAGLVAEGKTEVNRVYHIDRGYEHIDEKLLEVGAKIRRLQV